MAGLATGVGGRSNPWLDLVRAIAIVLVLLRHGQRAVGQGSLDWMKAISLNGWVGVDIFFVLSGYLIARHLLRAGIGSSEFSFGRYLAMRALRIVPSYLAVIGLILAGAFPLYAIDGDQIWLRLGYHLLFLQDYLPSDINIVFWSLGVEEKFYLLAPVLIFLLLRFQSAGARTAILATCFLLPLLFRFEAYNRIDTPLDYEHFFPIFRSPFHMTLEGLVAGVTIAIIQASGRLRASKTAGMAIFAGSVAILLFWMSSHDFMANIGVVDAIWQPMGLAVVAGAMTVGAVLLAEVRLPFGRLVNVTARLSYTLYLVHFPLIPTALAVASMHGSAYFWPTYLGTSLGAATLLHLAIEKPFLVWKDRLASRQSVRAQASAA